MKPKVITVNVRHRAVAVYSFQKLHGKKQYTLQSKNASIVFLFYIYERPCQATKRYPWNVQHYFDQSWFWIRASSLKHVVRLSINTFSMLALFTACKGSFWLWTFPRGCIDNKYNNFKNTKRREQKVWEHQPLYSCRETNALISSIDNYNLQVWSRWCRFLVFLTFIGWLQVSPWLP